MSSTLSPLNMSEPDEYAFLRALAVAAGIIFLIAVACCIKKFRASRASRSRIRKYDIVTAQHLQTGLMEDSDSDDDIFSSVISTQTDTQQLVPPPESPLR